MNNSYLRLLAMTILSFISMYIFMYAMVDRLDNVYPNHNQFYMAALMTAPMVLIELAVMRGMYSHRVMNMSIAAFAALVLVCAFILIRQQIGIGDRQFLRSMIPHHAGALLMCQNPSLRDAEIRRLCQTIIAGQQTEIDEMKSILHRLESQ